MAFKMAGFSAFTKETRLEGERNPKKTDKKVESTDSLEQLNKASVSGVKLNKEKISHQDKLNQNIEFNAYAEEQGWKPPTPDASADDSPELKNYMAFYSNKDNVNFLNKKKKEYFASKNK
tara:strand:+ start:148 stop:507 length:360 start_codon:yes stop_codon:yes gene_type:complete